MALQDEGERVRRERVARLMREMGIEGLARRRFKAGTTMKLHRWGTVRSGGSEPRAQVWVLAPTLLPSFFPTVTFSRRRPRPGLEADR